MPDDIRETIRQGLADRGTPLEFRAARALAEAAFVVRQGRAYLARDGAELKVREIDVLAELPERFSASVYAVVECKKTAAPWVVLEAPGPPASREIMDGLIVTTSAAAQLQRAYSEPQSVLPRLLARTPDRTAFQVVDPTSKQDAPYQALSQVVSACLGTLAERPLTRGLAWPVVAISGPLFAATYGLDPDSSDEPEIVERRRERLLWHGGPAGRPVLVDIVTIDALADHAERLFQGLAEIAHAIEAEDRPGRA
jgi:hypothetical protein